GGTLAAFLSAWILPIYGWRTLFVLGGIIPIALAILLFKVLPESPRYLASRRERWPDLIALLRRLGHDTPADANFVEAGGGHVQNPRPPMRDLSVPPFRRDPLGLLPSLLSRLLPNYGVILPVEATL